MKFSDACWKLADKSANDREGWERMAKVSKKIEAVQSKVHECTRCGESLDVVVWLEMNMYTAMFYAPGTVPEDKSQGVFPFGRTCAKRELAETQRREKKNG